MTEDTRTKTEQDIENEKNSTKTPKEFNSNAIEEAPNNVKQAIKQYRKQRISLTMNNVNEELLCQAYINGELSAKEWSLLSPALRKVCERYAKKHKKIKRADKAAQVEIVQVEQSDIAEQTEAVKE